MKLLYIASGHPLQEADDCLMWEKLGIDWFSTGYYAISDKPGDLPYIEVSRPMPMLLEFLQQQRTTHPTDISTSLCGRKNFIWTSQEVKNKILFTESFLDRFDAIFFNFFVSNIIDNINVLKGRKVFLKTYSMHNPHDEPTIKMLRETIGLKVIRNNPKEHLRSKRTYGGEDATIRGSVVKDEHELSGWTGETKEICTFTSFMDADRRRQQSYKECIDKLNFKAHLYGVGSNFISHEEKIEVLRKCRVNLVTGTPNASNTYSFVEAWIMGQPMVIFGKKMWQSVTYEPNDLIKHGETGFIGNKPSECQEYIKMLMKDDNLALKISKASREAALKVYGRETLSQQWINFFAHEGLI